MKRVLRFQVIGGYTSSPVGFTMNIQQMLGLQLVNAAATGTTAASVANAFRITKVKVWQIDNTSTPAGTATLTLTWLGNAQGLGITETVTAVGTTAIPAHISSTPPLESECSMWHNYVSATNNGTALLFSIFGLTTDDIVDIHFDYIPGSLYDPVAKSGVPLASSQQVWTIPAIQAGHYVQNLPLAGTMGAATLLSPVGLASVSPTAVTYV